MANPYSSQRREAVADRLPAYKGVLTDTEAMLWIVRSVPGDARTHLRAVGHDGKVVGDVRIPKNLVVLEVGSEYVLGLHNSEDGEATHSSLPSKPWPALRAGTLKGGAVVLDGRSTVIMVVVWFGLCQRACRA